MRYDRFTFNPMNFNYGVEQQILINSQWVTVRFKTSGVYIKAFSKKIMPDSDLPVIRVIETLDLEAYSFTEDCLAPMGACEAIEIENKQIEFTTSIEYERILSNEYEYLKTMNHPKHKLFEKVFGDYDAYYNKVKFLDDFEAAILQIKKMVHEENHRQYKLKLKYNIK